MDFKLLVSTVSTLMQRVRPHKIPFHAANPLRSAPSQPRPQPLAKYGHGRRGRRHRVPLSLLVPPPPSLPLPSFMPPILFGGSTPMRPGSNHGTKERGTAGPPQGKAGTAGRLPESAVLRIDTRQPRQRLTGGRFIHNCCF